ncbi:uncharacterized protein LOC118424857 [Branchiostoma floridae]|uniref:Uncharacterized protein LOC118424857 n=1 Tax=Branchiostoma floridae TaxID=7739 RepID=A0A9J7LUI5_BRAFL|nr:uncharacterized protein LOC118424857 [Branchiostoma floridae]
MAMPYPRNTRTCVRPLWRTLLAFMYNLLVSPWMRLFCHFIRHQEDSHPASVPREPIAASPDIQQAVSESTNRPTPVLSVSQPEESSEPEDSSVVSVFVTSKTDIAYDDHAQVSVNPANVNVPESEVGEGVDETLFKTTIKGRNEDLLYLLRKLDGDSRAIAIVRKLLQETLEQDGVSYTDETSDEETSLYVSVDLALEDDGDDDVDAMKDHTQEASSASPLDETAATAGKNVAEEPSGDQDTTEETAGAETDQTVSGSNRNDIGPLRSLTAEERNTASDYFTGTPDNSRPPDNDDQEQQENCDIDSGPHEMLHLDHLEPSNTTGCALKQRDCFNADTFDETTGPSGLFEIEVPENPGPPNANGADGLVHDEETERTRKDDCGGINVEVDSGPKEMLHGVSFSKALEDIRLNHGDDEDNEPNRRYHGDVCCGDVQPPRDAWGLERHEEVADKGLVVSAMKHVSKPAGQDTGIVGQDMDDPKLSIEGNSRASFDMGQQGLRVNNNNNDAMGRTPDMDCG